ncbi:MAG: NifB/NifX family molybdenum-iron cluster-binding protein [Desulfobacterales bacterium]
MKVAVSSTGKDLNAQIDPRFGRCAFFVVINPDDMSFEAFDNENMALSGGAGIQAAGFLSSKGVNAVLTGNCGPNAMKTFAAANIQVFTGMTGTVAEAVEKYKQGTLSPSSDATVSKNDSLKVETAGGAGALTGVGRCKGGAGRGMGGGGGGRGMGVGRCMGGAGRGMGMGRGLAMQETNFEAKQPYTTKENLVQLKEQAAELQRQIEIIQTKIKTLQQEQ